MTRRATHSDGEEAMALLARGRRATTTEPGDPAKEATMATDAQTQLRRCIGSTRFGIEAHEARVSDFPTQPSRPDGLGLMCALHWKAYVRGLRDARTTGKAAAPKAPKTAATKASTKRERRRSPMAHIPTPRTRKRAKPPANGTEVAQAEALIAQVDALPAPEMVRRVGDNDVQAALEVAANGRASATPLDEAIESETGEADAA